MDQETLRAFATRVRRDEVGPGVQIRYRVSGGMPSQRLDCEVVLDPVDGATITRYDALAADPARTRTTVAPERIDVRGIFNSISRGLASLTPADQPASRRPDALRGRLTIRVDDAREEFHFVPEREKRGPADTLPASIDQALETLWELATTTGERGQETGDA